MAKKKKEKPGKQRIPHPMEFKADGVPGVASMTAERIEDTICVSLALSIGSRRWNFALTASPLSVLELATYLELVVSGLAAPSSREKIIGGDRITAP